jgi:hypothetical protein
MPAQRVTQESKQRIRWGKGGSPGAGFEDSRLCSVCRGQCCRAIPGATYPADWADQRQILGALMSGRYVIDCWESDSETIYYIRPAVRDGIRSPEPVYDLSWGGTCLFLTASGCQLPLRDRPATCRSLEPRPGYWGWGENHCWAHKSRRDASIAWLPYQEILRQLGLRAKKLLSGKKAKASDSSEGCET